MKYFTLILLTLISIFFSGCSGSSSDGISNKDGLSDTEFAALVADTAVALWTGTDFTYAGTGNPGIDGAGSIIQTLIYLGYAVPNTTADGLYTNQDSVSALFDYTIPSSISDEDLEMEEYDQLAKGDLIFLDYDFDSVYDHVAIYLGNNGTYTHAAFTMSDYYDEGVVANMEDYMDPFPQDILWSQISSRTLNHTAIDQTYSP